MSTYIPVGLRQLVISRAAGICEYCHFPQALALFTFEIEHIIAEKHGGATTAENLALACFFCNRYKGSDIGSLDPETGLLTPLFHPRNQLWNEHFMVEGLRIVPRTAEGRVTVYLLRLNDHARLLERKNLWS
jgi:hypothetical protein